MDLIFKEQVKINKLNYHIILKDKRLKVEIKKGNDDDIDSE